MKISGAYTVAVPREKAYALLQDPSVLAQCMPGTDTLEKIGEDEYRMKMKMAIASFSGLFTGKVMKRRTLLSIIEQTDLSIEGLWRAAHPNQFRK